MVLVLQYRCCWSWSSCEWSFSSLLVSRDNIAWNSSLSIECFPFRSRLQQQQHHHKLTTVLSKYNDDPPKTNSLLFNPTTRFHERNWWIHGEKISIALKKENNDVKQRNRDITSAQIRMDLQHDLHKMLFNWKSKTSLCECGTKTGGGGEFSLVTYALAPSKRATLAAVVAVVSSFAADLERCRAPVVPPSPSSLHPETSSPENRAVCRRKLPKWNGAFL